MRLPPRRILVRLLIYVPLIGFFGWQALQRYLEEKDAAKSAPETLQTLPTRTITLPDGSQHQIYEVTPEQAEQMFGVEPQPSNATRPSAPARSATGSPNDSNNAAASGDAKVAPADAPPH